MGRIRVGHGRMAFVHLMACPNRRQVTASPIAPVPQSAAAVAVSDDGDGQQISNAKVDRVVGNGAPLGIEFHA